MLKTTSKVYNEIYYFSIYDASQLCKCRKTRAYFIINNFNQNSGLYDYILPMFTKDTGILVKVVAVGTGQAIRIARNGDADALLVHHRPSEDLFIKDNFGKERFDVMYNDFVLIGPQKNKTKFETLSDFFIKAKTTSLFPFISRGDDSGTHKKEIELWNIFTNSKPTKNGTLKLDQEWVQL